VTRNSAHGATAVGGGIFIGGSPTVGLHETKVTRNTPDNCFPPGGIVGCTA
jgi:hypothetical protein